MLRTHAQKSDSSEDLSESTPALAHESEAEHLDTAQNVRREDTQTTCRKVLRTQSSESNEQRLERGEEDVEQVSRQGSMLTIGTAVSARDQVVVCIKCRVYCCVHCRYLYF